MMEQAARQAGFECGLIVVGEIESPAQSPPGFTTELLADVPAALLVTGKSLSHTDERRAACREHGTRIASMPGLTEDILLRLFKPGSADRVRRATVELAEMLEDVRRVKIETEAGTQLSLSVAGRRLYLDTGMYRRPGDFGNLPAGEVAWGPVEGSAQGRIVADVAFAGIGAVEELVLVIEDGRVVDTDGDYAGEVLRLLKGEPERLLGEFGAGSNPLARPGAITLEAEKCAGTVHFGFGENRSFGGSNRASGHWDCVVKCDRLDVDGRVVELRR
jgi:leucyl aminopeptidase (aminopeptidase T)